MTTTYRTALKCMACGLHFNVYSWEESWLKTHVEDPGPFCPECGTAGACFPLGQFPMEGQIFEYVPGMYSEPRNIV
jgi:hypothetical protein